jgi:hypothetical protein
LEWQIQVKRQVPLPACYRVSGIYEEREVTEGVRDAFADIAIQLGAKMDELLPEEKSELDLDQSYKDNPMLAHVRSEVLKQTTSKPIFKESADQLACIEIFERIKPEWDAFVNCPWSPEIWGTLALLKYHLENGESPRFWTESFESQFGFRLRTRDHDWIVGQIYIDPSGDKPSGKSRVKVHCQPEADHDRYRITESGNWVASLGRMFITVGKGM